MVAKTQAKAKIQHDVYLEGKRHPKAALDSRC
jgi:hypothetical protein